MKLGGRGVVAQGLTSSPWADVYYTAMVVSWPKFLGVPAVMFCGLNVLFAGLLMLGKECRGMTERRS